MLASYWSNHNHNCVASLRDGLNPKGQTNTLLKDCDENDLVYSQPWRVPSGVVEDVQSTN